MGLFTIALFIGFNNVYATEGPLESDAYVSLSNGSDDYYMYLDGVVDNTSFSSATYDKDTNTLTINNVKGDYELFIYRMGDDFKLNVVGKRRMGYYFKYYW